MRIRWAALLIPALFAGIAPAQMLKLNPNPLRFTYLPDETGTKSGSILVGGVSDFVFEVQVRNPAPPRNDWLTVTRSGMLLTVQVTRRSGLGKGEYSAIVTITAGGARRTVPVTLQVFPQISISISTPEVNYPDARGDYPSRRITATVRDNQGLDADRIYVNATVDPDSPDRAAVAVTPPSVGRLGTNSGEFVVSVDPAELSLGDHAVLITFENQVNREQVYLNVAISVVQAQRYTISGSVRTAQGQGVPGVKVDFDNGPSVITDASGSYAAVVRLGYSGFAVPSLAGYTFVPERRSYRDVQSDRTEQNYTAYSTTQQFRISGTITTSAGQPLSGATVAFSAGPVVQTDRSGAYGATVDAGYSGTATPSLAGYTFSPPNRSYSNVRAAAASQDYTAAPVPTSSTVSGLVRDQTGQPAGNVMLAFSGGPTVSTKADGTYSVTLPAGYSGTVTASRPGYRLEPATRPYAALPPVLSGEDYVAWLQPSVLAQMISPPPGSTLGGGTATFQWTPGGCANGYFLAIGTNPEGNDLFNGDASGRAVTVSGLPTDGRTLYVRLYSFLDGDVRYNDYVYTAADARRAPAAAQMLAPNSDRVNSSTLTFQWSAGAGVSQYFLTIGRQPGGSDLLNQDQGTALMKTVSGLPANGSRIYVRLQSRIGSEWRSNEYVYTMPSGAETGKAEMISPVPGAGLCSDSAVFQWTRGSGVTQYFLAVGSSPGGNDLLNADAGTDTSYGVEGLPGDGRLIYVRLFSLIAGAWYSNDYVYGAPQY